MSIDRRFSCALLAGALALFAAPPVAAAGGACSGSVCGLLSAGQIHADVVARCHTNAASNANVIAVAATL